MNTASLAVPRTRPAPGWPVPAALLVLTVVPLIAGALRLLELSGGPALLPSDRRFDGFPVALVAHILGAAVYAVVGAFQFLPRFRRHHLIWHRRAGRALAGAGLLVAGSALWLTLGYPPKAGTGDLLYAMRLIFASAMIASLVLGINAARHRDIRAHRTWMIRAYAIALAAGTQVFTEGLADALFSSTALGDDLAKTVGWLINLVVAEWVIRRPGRAGHTHITG